jgi:hypothetical protein
MLQRRVESAVDAAIAVKNFEGNLGAMIKPVRYPASADPQLINYPMVLLLLVCLLVTVAMVYRLIAATLVELFPTRIRSTAMSLPYLMASRRIGLRFSSLSPATLPSAAPRPPFHAARRNELPRASSCHIRIEGAVTLHN